MMVSGFAANSKNLAYLHKLVTKWYFTSVSRIRRVLWLWLKVSVNFFRSVWLLAAHELRSGYPTKPKGTPPAVQNLCPFSVNMHSGDDGD